MNTVQEKTRVFVYDNAVVTVHFADITEEERARRMKLIHDAAAELILEDERVRNIKGREN